MSAGWVRLQVTFENNAGCSKADVELLLSGLACASACFLRNASEPRRCGCYQLFQSLRPVNGRNAMWT
jgi:hypothetical protein